MQILFPIFILCNDLKKFLTEKYLKFLMQAEFEKQSRKDPESQLRRNKITARIVGTHLAQLSNGEHRVDCRL